MPAEKDEEELTVRLADPKSEAAAMRGPQLLFNEHVVYKEELRHT